MKHLHHMFKLKLIILMLFFSFLSCQNLEKKESFTSHMRQEEQGPTVSSCPDLDLQAFSSVILPQLKKKLGEWI